MAKKKKQPPPQSRQEGCERITKLTQYLYDYKGVQSEVSAALLDAAFLSIDGVTDPDEYHTLLQETLQAAYERLKKFEG
jgi:hypothetical protein